MLLLYEFLTHDREDNSQILKRKTKTLLLTLLVNIIDISEVVHVGQQHCSFDNCREQ